MPFDSGRGFRRRVLASRAVTETIYGSLRVVQVVCTDAFAGIERYVATLANGLAHRGCRVIVLGGEAQRMSRELSPSVEAWHPARGMLEALTTLATIGRADIVHAHMTHAELAATLTLPLTGGRLVVTRHFAARRGSGPAGRAAAVAIRRAIDLQLACSAYVAARVDGPCEVIWPGVPPNDAARERERERVVLVVQRLEPQKDTATALRAWACSGLGDRGWDLHVVGDGTERRPLERLAAELAIERSCRFLGARDEVQIHLVSASILIAAAPNEPFGLSVVEAMGAGLPVVATASGGHLETVGACADAVLFSPGDSQTAGRLLRDLADDEARRADYGHKLLELQRDRFSAERQVARTLARYQSLAARS